MELNETLAKVDQNLDSTVKKIEKQALEMCKGDLRIEISKAQQGKNKISRNLTLIQSTFMITSRISIGMTTSSIEAALLLKLQA